MGLFKTKEERAANKANRKAKRAQRQAKRGESQEKFGSTLTKASSFLGSCSDFTAKVGEVLKPAETENLTVTTENQNTTSSPILKYVLIGVGVLVAIFLIFKLKK
jgi:hypothetical protein